MMPNAKTDILDNPPPENMSKTPRNSPKPDPRCSAIAPDTASKFTPGNGMKTPTRHKASRPSVIRVFLRSSGILAMLANAENMPVSSSRTKRLLQFKPHLYCTLLKTICHLAVVICHLSFLNARSSPHEMTIQKIINRRTQPLLNDKSQMTNAK